MLLHRWVENQLLDHQQMGSLFNKICSRIIYMNSDSNTQQFLPQTPDSSSERTVPEKILKLGTAPQRHCTTAHELIRLPWPCVPGQQTWMLYTDVSLPEIQSLFSNNDLKLKTLPQSSQRPRMAQ